VMSGHTAASSATFLLGPSSHLPPRSSAQGCLVFARANLECGRLLPLLPRQLAAAGCNPASGRSAAAHRREPGLRTTSPAASPKREQAPRSPKRLARALNDPGAAPPPLLPACTSRPCQRSILMAMPIWPGTRAAGGFETQLVALPRDGKRRVSQHVLLVERYLDLPCASLTGQTVHGYPNATLRVPGYRAPSERPPLS
jgi:hypothetical protein